MSRKYSLPPFLSGIVSQVLRTIVAPESSGSRTSNLLRGNVTAIGEVSREAIRSVWRAKDATLIPANLSTGSSSANTIMTDQRHRVRKYKRDFARASSPTVDHVSDGLGSANFKICGWRTNDTKNDLEMSEFLSVCRAVLETSMDGSAVSLPGRAHLRFQGICVSDQLFCPL